MKPLTAGLHLPPGGGTGDLGTIVIVTARWHIAALHSWATVGSISVGQEELHVGNRAPATGT